MIPINLKNRLPEGVSPEAIPGERVAETLAKYGWTPLAKELADSLEAEIAKARPQPVILGALGIAWDGKMYYPRILLAKVPAKAHLEAAAAFNRMIQDYMEQFLESKGVLPIWRSIKKSSLDSRENN